MAIHTRDKKPLIIISALTLSLIAAIIAAILLFQNKTDSNPQTQPFLEATNHSLDETIQQKNISEVNDLVEIQGEKYVAQITDIEKLKEIDEQFARSYNGDIVVFLTDKTIIYDSSTKTIRDIIGKSFLDQVRPKAE